ncbi:hypothetical protein Bca4012_085004 [Brassica carinata]
MYNLDRFPPCQSSNCFNPECCPGGHKFKWPELVGKNGEMAKMTIERENQNVTGIIMPIGSGKINFCCNRVYIYIDSNHNVVNVPILG